MTPEPTACWRTMNAAWDRSSLLSRSGPYPVTRIWTTAGETLAASVSRAWLSWTKTLGGSLGLASLALGTAFFSDGDGEGLWLVCARENATPAKRKVKARIGTDRAFLFLRMREIFAI